MIPRWLIAVFVVVAVLLTAWASYNLVRQTSASKGSSSAPPVMAYGGSGSYVYVATLAPNDLYNSTTVTGTNVTLFAPITRSINVTFVDGVTLTSVAATQMVDHFSVTLSTPAWSKTIDQAVQQRASANSTSLAIVDRYGLNVSWVENLTQTIDSQLGYSSSQFTVTFAPTVTGAVTLGNGTAPLSLSPFLNLTFAGSLITPNGLEANFQGGVPTADGPTGSTNAVGVIDAWVFLAASVGGLAAALGLLWVSWNPGRSLTIPDLDTLTEPYEEVIVLTSKVPDATTTLPVERWDDLVKVSDTLGRPILRPLNGPGGRPGTSLYVVDGQVVYTYNHPSAETLREEAPDRTSELLPGSVTTPPQPIVLESARTGAAGIPAVLSAASNLTPIESVRAVTEQLRADLDRIERTPLSPAEHTKAIELVRTTARLLRAARPSETPHILEEFHRALEDHLSKVAHP